MKLLHITDFHFRADRVFKQNQLIDRLISEVKKIDGISFVCFTGDLVNEGNDIQSFTGARQTLLDRLMTELEISNSQVFICAGNHDVMRGAEMDAVGDKIAKFESNPTLDSFVKDERNREFEESLQNLKNYLAFQEGFFSNPDQANADTISSLFTIHHRTVENKKIGIATINTAWRSRSSKSDRGSLLYPAEYIRNIAEQLKGADFRILLLHHPLSDLSAFNATELEDLIHDNFHLMLNGHIHKTKQALYITSDDGIFCCTSPATLSLYENNSTIGFTVLDIDVDSLEVGILNFNYNKQTSSFARLPEQLAQIPVNSNKRAQNDFRKTISKRLNEEIERANDLFLSIDSGRSRNVFQEVFTTPILKSKSKAELIGEKKDVPRISIEDIEYKYKNVLIFGKDKIGKTALLLKMNIEMLSDFAERRIIPFYIDCKVLKGESGKIDLLSMFSRHFEVSKNGALNLINNYQLRLLVDNFDPANTSLNSEISRLIDSVKGKTSYIFSAEETMSRKYEPLKLPDPNTFLVYIHEISRSEVRELTNKWPNLTSEQKETIIPRITQIFKQLNIPLNYWMVSLFLWIYEKNSDVNIHNNIELVEYYVDGILDRSGIVFQKDAKITYEDFKIYISELAHELVQNHESFAYAMDYARLIEFTDSYSQINKRFVMPVEEIVSLLINKGILRKRSDGKYTFRLNGVFEYFIAYFMKNNLDFRKKVIENNNYYLSYGNELELCSGFNKLDRSYVEDIYEKTKAIFAGTNNFYSDSGLTDDILRSKIRNVSDISEHLSRLSTTKTLPISPTKQDEILEEVAPFSESHEEVERKKYYESITSSPENLEKALFILCRVYRNTSVSDDEFNNNLLDFILESACNLGFVLIDASLTTEEIDSEGDENYKTLLKLARNFMPLIIETYLFDALAQNNLERILKEKIDELKVESQNNQFKLLLLYLMLIDLDVNGHKDLIENVMDVVSLGTLRYTVLIKLYTYLMFKAYGNPMLEKFLSEKIQKQHLKINDKTSLKEVQQGIEQKKRILKARGGQAAT